jgi:hypothetical protein
MKGKEAMSDPRGYQEVKLTTGTHRLQFKQWDIAEIEEQTGRTIHQLFGDVVSNFGLRQCLIALSIGLRHEDPEMTPERVADLMIDGSYDHYFNAIAQAIRPRMSKSKPNGEDVDDRAPLAEMNTGADFS